MRAQDPLKTLPQNYRLVLGNGDVAVIHAHYGAHEKIPVHDHPSISTVFVYLNDSGQVRIDHTDGDKVESVVRPPTFKGSYRVAAGIAERHSIENLGDTDSDFLRVELKRIDLKLAEPFRGKAPQTLAVSKDSVEYSDASLQIERVICVGSSACPLMPVAGPSLLIAFTPLEVKVAGANAEEKMDDGEVRWLASSESATIRPEGDSPAHVLRIILAGGAR